MGNRKIGGAVVADQTKDALNAILARIVALAEYESSWDPDRPGVNPESIETAKTLIQDVYDRLRDDEVPDFGPMISVDPNGHIHVLWGARGSNAIWVISGSLEQPIALIVRRPESKPILEKASREAAVQAALEALGPVSGSGE